MPDEPLSAEPTPVPQTAWTGRSWWKVCCTGCCLGFAFLIVGSVIYGGSHLFESKPGAIPWWDAFRAAPGQMWERVKELFPSQS